MEPLRDGVVAVAGTVSPGQDDQSHHDHQGQDADPSVEGERPAGQRGHAAGGGDVERQAEGQGRRRPPARRVIRRPRTIATTPPV